jgi:hypothetical protein
VYGHPKKKRQVWLEAINCNGTESHIDDCQHSGWVKPEKRLSFYDLAGVMCHTEIGRILVPPIAQAWGDIKVGMMVTFISMNHECYVITRFLHDSTCYGQLRSMST